MLGKNFYHRATSSAPGVVFYCLTISDCYNSKTIRREGGEKARSGYILSLGVEKTSTSTKTKGKLLS
jgi:hypothetical protein